MFVPGDSRNACPNVASFSLVNGLWIRWLLSRITKLRGRSSIFADPSMRDVSVARANLADLPSAVHPDLHRLDIATWTVPGSQLGSHPPTILTLINSRVNFNRARGDGGGIANGAALPAQSR
jgi:hypothetical protein